MRYVVFSILMMLTACGSSQKQETTQTVHAQQATLESSQDAVQSRGANVKGDVEEVITNNTTGFEWWQLILIGVLIPMPRIIRWIF